MTVSILEQQLKDGFATVSRNSILRSQYHTTTENHVLQPEEEHVTVALS